MKIDFELKLFTAMNIAVLLSTRQNNLFQFPMDNINSLQNNKNKMYTLMSRVIGKELLNHMRTSEVETSPRSLCAVRWRKL